MMKQTNKTKRKTKVRAKLRQAYDRLRLSVFRSNKSIYGQIIDDKKGKTLMSSSFKDLDKKQQKEKGIELAKLIGKKLAEKAILKKVKKVSFDRGGYKYHGKVKAFAEGARDGGLEF